MNKYLVILTICTIGILFRIQSASADSLFNQTSPNGKPVNMDLYTTPNPDWKINDIIMVEVYDRSSADLESNYKGKQEFSSDYKTNISNPNNYKIPTFIKSLFNPLKLLFARDIKSDTSKEYKGKGNTSNTSSVIFYLSAVVVEVLENGNLIIEGRRQMNVNRETQTAIVRGMIRQDDIDRKTNTINAERIADCTVQYVGQGEASRRTRPGFLSQIFDVLF